MPRKRATPVRAAKVVKTERRLDWLAMQLAEAGGKMLQDKTGLEGLWRELEPHVSSLVKQHIPKRLVDISPLADSLAKVIGTNMGRGEIVAGTGTGTGRKDG